jgi:hypothetical protein
MCSRNNEKQAVNTALLVEEQVVSVFMWIWWKIVKCKYLENL